ncbi:vacuolar-processing enzyme alpha-isozyme-like [Mangifera indica]|uniref:vacuolar-processing enzyme alpha-isozyme-like n=1 Tax=Mangifera indica TaxID=29780 RepID=UPI001CF9B3C1|nr:vacuolar-processing enzyme alpha-isozyme-like [Mangifera indica]
MKRSVTMNSSILAAIFLLSLLSFAVESQKLDHTDSESTTNGTQWAVLIAASKGYINYRHQASVCHAYQILKSRGLKDENIIVFMYDDIIHAEENTRPGIIINKPNGTDVYRGVPKDYTGENINVNNFLAVILGNRTALTGGSGKVVNSGPNDHIFIYYTDHGAPGILEMPSGVLYAKDLIDALQKKYEAKAYKKMVIYVEACNAGSMFEGLLPETWNIYVMTASNSSESSSATYCPDYPPAPTDLDTCLGDLFSVSWMEDSETHDLQKETLEQQYRVVRNRTLFSDESMKSHVMRYGNIEGIRNDSVSTYFGLNPRSFIFTAQVSSSLASEIKVLDNRDVDINYLQHKFNKALEGSNEKIEAQKRLNKEISKRQREDFNIQQILTILFGYKNGQNIVQYVRPTGQPLVDNWDCFKMLMGLYEEHCGSLSTYGKKYARAMANMCNVGINKEKMIMALTQVCKTS